MRTVLIKITTKAGGHKEAKQKWYEILWCFFFLEFSQLYRYL